MNAKENNNKRENHGTDIMEDMTKKERGEGLSIKKVIYFLFLFYTSTVPVKEHVQHSFGWL